MGPEMDIAQGQIYLILVKFGWQNLKKFVGLKDIAQGQKYLMLVKFGWQNLKFISLIW